MGDVRITVNILTKITFHTKNALHELLPDKRIKPLRSRGHENNIIIIIIINKKINNNNKIIIINNNNNNNK